MKEIDEVTCEITVDEFMGHFVRDGGDPETYDVSVIEETKLEKFQGQEIPVYPILCEFFQTVLHGSGRVAKDTGNWPPSNDKTPCSRLPDGAAYDADNMAHVLEEEYWKTSDLKADSPRKPYAGRVSWPDMLFFWEVKTDYQHSGFTVPGQIDGLSLLRSTPKGLETRGQLAEYATTLQGRQHRRWLFSMYFFQDTVRFMRWDRLGLIVTNAFSYKENPQLLYKFVHRLGRMTREQLGFDSSVTLASDAEVERALAYTPIIPRLKEYLATALSNRTAWPAYKVQVSHKQRKAESPFSDTSSPEFEYVTKEFLIGKPRAESWSPTGRATKGYVAFDLERRTLVFLKDCWRVDSDEVHPEVEVYEKLRAAGVSNIATVVCGGDVGEPNSQRTASQRFITGGFCARVHYRFVVEEVGRPIDEYSHSYEMCKVVYDALTAHQEAWLDAGVLHRDISTGNILIIDVYNEKSHKVSPVGILNDWDMCKYKEELGKPSTDKARSGTWVFLSALLVNYPKKQYEVSDDLESFVHVVNWLALRWQAHNMSGEEGKTDLANHLQNMYESSRTVQGFDIGSQRKLESMETGAQGFKLRDQSGLYTIIQSLMVVCKEHYAAVCWEALDQYKATAARKIAPLPLDRLTTDFSLKPKRLLSNTAEKSAMTMSTDSAQIATHSTASPTIPSSVAMSTQPQPRSLVLSTHDAIIDVFYSVLADSATVWLNDKMEHDQFDNIPQIFGPVDIKTYGNEIRSASAEMRKSANNKASEPSSKRKSSGKKGSASKKIKTSATLSQHGSSEASRISRQREAGPRSGRTLNAVPEEK